MKVPKKKVNEIALLRIDNLFKLAEENFKKNFALSNRYVEIARNIAVKNRTRMPKKYRVRFCKKCLSYLVPGVNCRVRNYKKRMHITCLNCGYVRKIGIK